MDHVEHQFASLQRRQRQHFVAVLAVTEQPFDQRGIARHIEKIPVGTVDFRDEIAQGVAVKGHPEEIPRLGAVGRVVVTHLGIVVVVQKGPAGRELMVDAADPDAAAPADGDRELAAAIAAQPAVQPVAPFMLYFFDDDLRHRQIPQRAKHFKVDLPLPDVSEFHDIFLSPHLFYTKKTDFQPFLTKGV